MRREADQKEASSRSHWRWGIVIESGHKLAVIVITNPIRCHWRIKKREWGGRGSIIPLFIPVCATVLRHRRCNGNKNKTKIQNINDNDDAVPKKRRATRRDAMQRRERCAAGSTAQPAQTTRPDRLRGLSILINRHFSFPQGLIRDHVNR